MQTVWIFNGVKSNFPSAVFSNKEEADRWISKNRLTGILTEYPVGISVYDWVINEGKWMPKKPEHHTPEYIGKFSSAYQDHYHYENGEEA